MSAGEEKLCLTQTLPSEYRMGHFGAKEYKLDTKSLILDNVFLDIDGVTYTRYATVYWDRNKDMKSYDLCTMLEKDVAILLKKEKIKPLVTNTDSVRGNTKILGDGIIRTVSGYSNAEDTFLTKCQVEVCFPSVDVYSDGDIWINAVLKNYIQTR